MDLALAKTDKPFPLDAYTGVGQFLWYRPVITQAKLIFWYLNGENFERAYKTFDLDFLDARPCNKDLYKSMDDARFICLMLPNNPSLTKTEERQFVAETSTNSLAKGSAVICEQTVCGMYIEKNGDGYTAINLASYGMHTTWIANTIDADSFDYFEKLGILRKDIICRGVNGGFAHLPEFKWFFVIIILGIVVHA